MYIKNKMYILVRVGINLANSAFIGNIYIGTVGVNPKAITIMTVKSPFENGLRTVIIIQGKFITLIRHIYQRRFR
jgi:hypothetical protein